MKRFILIFLVIVTSTVSFGQTSESSIEELETLKSEAVNNEDFKRASLLKKAIDLKLAINEAVKSEDYRKASDLKKQLQELLGENTQTEPSDTVEPKSERAEAEPVNTPAHIGTTDLTPNDIYLAKTNLVWLGIDITNAKFIGPGFNDLSAIKYTHIPAWTSMQFRPDVKWTLAERFEDDIVFDTEYMDKRNKGIDIESMITNSAEGSELNNQRIQDIVSTYDFDKINTKSGIGFCYIVESLNKLTNEVNINVAFIDLRTGGIISVQKIEAEPSGIGFEAYWGNAFTKCNKRLIKKHLLTKPYMAKMSSGRALVFSLIPGGGDFFVTHRVVRGIVYDYILLNYIVLAAIEPPYIGGAIVTYIISSTHATISASVRKKKKFKPFVIQNE